MSQAAKAFGTKKKGKILKEPKNNSVKNDLELRVIKPITRNQNAAFAEWERGQHIVNHGYAGTGKSFVSLYLAFRSLKNGEFRKIYIVRSAVPTRDQGFLPGGVREKAEIYEGTYKSICSELFGRGDAYEVLKQKGMLEFITTSYVRGITIDDAVVFVDEIQNLTFHELDSIITRTGEGTRLILSGDVTQSDFVREGDKSGIHQFMKIVENVAAFSFIDYGVSDIVRSDFVRDYIIAKESRNGQK